MFDGKPTEPFYFILFKNLCTFFFIIFIIWYSYDQFSGLFTSELYKPKLDISNKHLIGGILHGSNSNITIEFCNANSINITNCQKFRNTPLKREFLPANECSYAYTDDFQMNCAKYEFAHDLLELMWLNISIEPSDRPTLLINSNAILNIINSTEYSEILTIYLSRFGFDGTYYNSTYNTFFLANNQVAIIDYSPIIKRDIVSTYLFGLVSRKEKYSYIDLDARMNILPFSSSQNTIQLGIRLKSPTVQFQDEFHPGSKY
jgi:hypothetical protein